MLLNQVLKIYLYALKVNFPALINLFPNQFTTSFMKYILNGGHQMVPGGHQMVPGGTKCWLFEEIYKK